MIAALAAAGAAAAATLAAADVVVLRRAALRAPRKPRSTSRLVALLTRIGRRLGVAPAPEDLVRRLAAAGTGTGIGPSEVMAVKTGAAIVALLAAVGPATALPGRLGPAAIVAVPLAALYAPDLWLRRRARVRARVMAREVADVLDLLRVCIEAGRAPGAALAEVGRRHRGLLGTELRLAAQRLSLGERRSDVLQSLAARCPLDDVLALTAALGRADRHGAPLAPALTAIAADARAARSRAVREQAGKAGPKIQLVVALLLVPAVMLLVGAALAAAFAAH